MSDYIIDILGPAHLSVADAICGMMIERGISPQQLSAAIAARNAELASELSAQAAQHKSPGAAQPMPEHTGQCPSCGGGRITMPVPAQVEEQRGNHSAANTDQSEPAPGYCPVCGSSLEMQQHCPGKVKHFRTSIACTNDACSYWHHSHLTIRELIHGTQIRA